VLAELGEDRLDAADCLAQAGGDRLAGALGGAGAQGPGAAGEPGGAAQLGQQGGPLIIQVLGASDVVIGAGGGQVLVEFGEAMSVGGACVASSRVPEPVSAWRAPASSNTCTSARGRASRVRRSASPL
jgi:hypothetical protein